MKNKIASYLLLFSVAGSIIAFDQWTKWLVREYIPFGVYWLPDWLEWLMPYARFVYWENSGAAFGLFQNGSLVFGSLAVVVIAAILYFYPQVEAGEQGMRIAMAMQMAGAAGNLIDRIFFQGKVTDFISIGAFPVFNVADASISLGVVVLLVDVWIKERREKRLQAATGNDLSATSADSPPETSHSPTQGPGE